MIAKRRFAAFRRFQRASRPPMGIVGVAPSASEKRSSPSIAKYLNRERANWKLVKDPLGGGIEMIAFQGQHELRISEVCVVADLWKGSARGERLLVTGQRRVGLSKVD